MAGHTRIVDALLDAGADPNAPRRAPPIEAAAGKAHVEVVKRLLNAGASRARAAHFALIGGSTEVCELLVRGGARRTEFESGGVLSVSRLNPEILRWADARGVRLPSQR